MKIHCLMIHNDKSSTGMLHCTQPSVLYKCFLPFNFLKLIFILEVIQVYSKKSQTEKDKQ